jgi:hypothetical protein
MRQALQHRLLIPVPRGGDRRTERVPSQPGLLLFISQPLPHLPVLTVSAPLCSAPPILQTSFRLLTYPNSGQEQCWCQWRMGLNGFLKSDSDPKGKEIQPLPHSNMETLKETTPRKSIHTAKYSQSSASSLISIHFLRHFHGTEKSHGSMASHRQRNWPNGHPSSLVPE